MTMNLKIMIVDDEPLAIEGLKLRLAQLSGVAVVAECTCGEEAIQKNKMLRPDLVFQDLEMPGLSGLEVVEAYGDEHAPLVVFVTAYSEYAIDAFDMHAVDYILKPASLGRLQQSIDRARERIGASEPEREAKLISALHQVAGVSMDALNDWLNSSEGQLPAPYPKKLAIKSSSGSVVMVPVNDIEWVDAAGDYMCIHANGETHILRITLKKLAQLLDPSRFQRVHKSTIVNTDYIVEIVPLRNTESMLILSCGQELKVSRKYKDDVQKLRQLSAPA